MSQTSYAQYQGTPFAGALGDYKSDSDIRSYVNAEATAAFPFGIGVVQGTADGGVILPTGSSDTPRGITVHDHTREPFYLPSSPTTAGIAAGATAGVLFKGRIWAIVDAAVVPGNSVYARYTTTTAPKDQKGRLGPSSDTSTALAFSGCQFLTTAAAAAAALVDVNMP